MKKILVLGGSSSIQSINKKFAAHAVSRLGAVEVTVLDLNDLPLPIFSVDLEEKDGQPENAQKLYDAIQANDALIVSLAEHNGSYTAAFKNLLDWTSRIDTKLWADKPMLLLATSPGARGGATVLAAATETFPHLGGNIVATFSLPSFYDNFSDEQGITDSELSAKFDEVLIEFESAL